jgi:orotate phosphoribosyltransferase-like protein
MPRMAAVERDEKTRLAVDMSAKGVSDSAIADALGIHRQTVKRLIEDHFASEAEHRGPGKERAIARYERVIANAWDRYERVQDASLNVSGLLNTILTAQTRIDKITGAESPTKIQHVEDELEVVWPDADGDAISHEPAAQEAGTP